MYFLEFRSIDNVGSLGFECLNENSQNHLHDEDVQPLTLILSLRVEFDNMHLFVMSDEVVEYFQVSFLLLSLRIVELEDLLVGNWVLSIHL